MYCTAQNRTSSRAGARTRGTTTVCPHTALPRRQSRHGVVCSRRAVARSVPGSKRSARRRRVPGRAVATSSRPSLAGRRCRRSPRPPRRRRLLCRFLLQLHLLVGPVRRRSLPTLLAASRPAATPDPEEGDGPMAADCSRRSRPGYFTFRDHQPQVRRPPTDLRPHQPFAPQANLGTPIPLADPERGPKPVWGGLKFKIPSD